MNGFKLLMYSTKVSLWAFKNQNPKFWLGFNIVIEYYIQSRNSIEKPYAHQIIGPSGPNRRMWLNVSCDQIETDIRIWDVPDWPGTTRFVIRPILSVTTKSEPSICVFLDTLTSLRFISLFICVGGGSQKKPSARSARHRISALLGLSPEANRCPVGEFKSLFGVNRRCRASRTRKTRSPPIRLHTSTSRSRGRYVFVPFSMILIYLYLSVFRFSVL